jgi:hypothetical protein
MSNTGGKISITGGCRCGHLRYEVTTAPLFVMACHCTDCQEHTASAFSLGMPVQKDGFSMSGEPVVITKTGESGNESRAYRCPTCAVWTHTTTDGSPEMVVVRPSTLDDTDWVRPVAQIFVRSAMPWAKLDVPHSYEKEFDDPSEIVATFRASGILEHLS